MSQPDVMDRFRNDFPSLERRRNGKAPIYLDSACTTLVPNQVIASITEYYSQFPSCGGRRSHHWFAEEVTRRVEGTRESGFRGSRQAVAEFINAASEKEIIFTMNTTHAINMVALGFNFKPGDVVLLSGREHNSNLLPWLRLQQEGRVKVDHMETDLSDPFDLTVFEQHFRNQTIRLVSLAWTSNVTGTTLPAKEIIAIAHRHGARVLLDGAQTVPHQPIDVRDLDVDFLAFSIHKMCGPRGVGILYGKRELLGGTNEKDYLVPVLLGGGTVDDTTYDSYKLLDTPDRFEAGIPNYSGEIASGATVDYLRAVGMERIAAHELELNRHLTRALLQRYGDEDWFTILGPQDAALRGGILSFDVRRPNATGIATDLDDKSNIMIRDGVFCVHSYFNGQYGLNWIHPKTHHDHRMIYRVSFYLYNTIQDCDIFVETLDEIFRERSYIF